MLGEEGIGGGMVLRQCGLEAVGCGGSCAGTEVRVSLFSIYVFPVLRHATHPLTPFSLALCATRTPLPVLTLVPPPDDASQSKYYPLPLKFLPLCMCLLKLSDLLLTPSSSTQPAHSVLWDEL